VTGFEAQRRLARDWLLGFEGRPIPITPENRGVLGHDSSLIGWPWVDGTHSWLEPTALAVLALCREGLRDHARVTAGVRVILDRAIKRGGWNYGNTAVFGRQLRPQPAPTGIALLALAAQGRAARSFAVSHAIRYLHEILPQVRSAVSLGWAVLGLRAHDACPAHAPSWLAESYGQCTGHPDKAVALSLLLLAAGQQSLELFLP
jgi:hypothetical protein